MKNLKYILFGSLLSLMVSFSSCGTKNNSQGNDSTYSVSIKSVRTMKNDTLNSVQLDSLITVDSLPQYSKWIKTSIKDGDNNKAYEYGTLYDKNSGIIYTVKSLRDKSVYVVQKKKTTSK